MMPYRILAIAIALVVGLAGCGDDDAPPAEMDAGVDAGETDAGPAPFDAGFDAGEPTPDSGPTPTGCELRDAAARDAAPPPDGATPDDDGGLPDPGAFPPPTGPGGPSTSFTADQLRTTCAFLDGGPTDTNHHNGVFMLDGYLVMPWAHEHGGGGITVFDFHDPCAPVVVGSTTSDVIRETHATGLSLLNGRWLVTASLSGILFWDVSDVTNPRVVADMTLPGVTYPDAYRRVVMSVFWQAPYVYVGAADNGVFVVDASDPANPVLLRQYVPVPLFRVGGVHAIGNLLGVLATEGARTVLYDISDPAAPRPIPGGNFYLEDGSVDRRGVPFIRLGYMGHLNGNRVAYARKDFGGGFIHWDISDPSSPRLIGAWTAPGAGSGGYVFYRDDRAYVGESDYAVEMDLSNPAMPVESARFDMAGDLDFITPIGNVVVVSVDDDGIDGQASGVFPLTMTPDTVPPRVNMVVPRDGATMQALGSRIGLTFTDFVDMSSVWRGSVIVRAVGTTAPLPGSFSGQEGAVGFTPERALDPDTEYEILVPAGGVRDVSGNPVTSPFRATFRTVSCAGM